ncbi:(d)CMP kinase [Oerskovia jenensis]|uniref:Cytidylate kinase n=1 Tax=Oerskovia jenensis TaxID=162169 RepID=A0ABS2LAS0_9CELL|nr:(d)CMP kinase [Oerskovia jenensis]MBM7477422.1 cytidylate kinase [Oerskovia jenensis]
MSGEPQAAAGARGLVVAIDGPSGSGKSSVSRAVARRLGTAYLDTGAMYRAATWWCLEEGIDLADQAAVAAAVDVMPLVMGIDPAAPSVHVGGTDVGEAIRTTEISTAVSAVATNLAVRAELRRLQRVIIAAESSASSASSAEGGDTSFSGGRGVVAEGRDITTVVAPDADVRILLTASEEARLARRSLEVHGAADDAAVEATKDQVLRRDRDDSTVSQFHVAADGVVTVDSSDLDFEQTVQAVLDVVDRVTATAAAGGEGTAR